MNRTPGVWGVAVRAALVVLAVTLGVPALLGAYIPWDSTFEGAPNNSEVVSEGARRIRDLKEQIRRRMQAEMEVGSGSLETGRLRAGAGRAFVSATAPTVISHQDANGHDALGSADNGRLWVDTTNSDTTGVVLKYYVDGTGWVAGAPPTSVVPQNGIILWDQATGCADEVNACPCGYALVTAANARTVIAADTTASDDLVCDTPACTTGQYDHVHAIGLGSLNATSPTSSVPTYAHTGVPIDNSTSANVLPVKMYGVLLCRKS